MEESGVDLLWDITCTSSLRSVQVRDSYAMDQMKRPLLSTGGAFRNTTESPLGLSSTECDSGSSDRHESAVMLMTSLRGQEKNDDEVQNKLNENETANIYISALFQALQVVSNPSATSRPAASSSLLPKNCCCQSTPLRGGFVFPCLLSFMRIL